MNVTLGQAGSMPNMGPSPYQSLIVKITAYGGQGGPVLMQAFDDKPFATTHVQQASLTGLLHQLSNLMMEAVEESPLQWVWI